MDLWHAIGIICGLVVKSLRHHGMDPKVLAPEGFLIYTSSDISGMFDNLICVIKGEPQYFMLVDTSMFVPF